MKVRVRLFASARQLAGKDVVEIAMADSPTIDDLRAHLTQQYPQLAVLVRHAMFAINAEYAQARDLIPPNSEVACIPPVSGG